MNYNIIHNTEKNGLEIYFDGKPAEEVRDALKALRFRWHNVKKCWYGRADESAVISAIGGSPAVKPEKKPAAKINLDGIENNKKTGYGAEFAAVLRADLKARGATGVTIRCNRSGYTDSITATIKLSADDFRSAEECAARDGWSTFFNREASGWGPTVDGVEYSHFYEGKETETQKYITCGAHYTDNSENSNFHILRRFWLSELSRFESVNEHNMNRDQYIELTDSAFSRVSAIVAIINSYNWDNSDPMSDYYDVGFYLDVDIKKPADYQPREFMTDAERVQLEKDLAAEAEAERLRFEEMEREHEAQRIEAERLAAQEAKDRAEIMEAVTIEDLPENAQYFVYGLSAGIGKESTIDELKSRADKTTDAYITRRVTFSTKSALDKFSAMLLHDFDFVAGKGGTATNDPRVTSENIHMLNREQREHVKFYAHDCIAVYFADVLQFVINPEGYDYARYCYIPNDNTREATPEASAGAILAEEKEEKPAFYFPAPVVEQAARLAVGDVVTLYQADDMILNCLNGASGPVESVKPGKYAQYSGVFITIKSGKKSRAFFCTDSDIIRKTLVFPGYALQLPEWVKHRDITESETVRTCFVRDNDDQLRQILTFYAENGRAPIFDTIKR